jgi:hypothetical protein
MVFDGNESLRVAQFLGEKMNGSCTLESVQRAAISRAYFAAFVHALYYEVDNGRFQRSPLDERGKDHGLLRKHFRDQKNHKIASELKELHNWRKTCDYDYFTDPSMLLSTALENSLRNARNIIGSLK